MADDHYPDDVPRATSLKVHVCDHGTLWIALLDENDKPMVIGTLDTEGAFGLLDDIHDRYEALLLKSVEPSGHA